MGRRILSTLSTDGPKNISLHLYRWADTLKYYSCLNLFEVDNTRDFVDWSYSSFMARLSKRKKKAVLSKVQEVEWVLSTNRRGSGRFIERAVTPTTSSTQSTGVRGSASPTKENHGPSGEPIGQLDMDYDTLMQFIKTTKV
jgi:hypothetical protein